MFKLLSVIFILLFLAFFLTPSSVDAGTIETIGNLKVGEEKSTRVSGLDFNKYYYWHVTSTTSFETNYEIYYCFFSDDNGDRSFNLGPYDKQGQYHIEITNTPTGGDCSSVGLPQAQADFNVLPPDPTISPPIGTLDVGEFKDVTISNFPAKTAYVWTELRKVGPNYREEYKECDVSDEKGIISKRIGPFDQTKVGIYKLEIHLRKNARVCQVNIGDNSVFSHDFSVGGATGTVCCVAPFDGYDVVKDECAKRVGRGQLSPLAAGRRPTECSKTGNFCDPSSVQCFKTKPQPSPGKTGPPAVSGGIPCDNDAANPGIATAIGCVHTSPIGLATDLLKFLIAISGGLALLMMALGAFGMITSAGNPEHLKAGQDRFTSAIIGLLFVILSIVLLKFIGVDILGIL